MPDIARIPAELWLQIIPEACVDGGYTGRSLALTNKFFHAQSLSSRFHSLAFTHLAKVEAFLAFLETQSKTCNPKIEHLYLSFENELEPPHPFDLMETGELPPEEYIRLCERADMQTQAWQERCIPAMARLFEVARSRLITLCIMSENHLPFPCSQIGNLPRLQELTLLGPLAILPRTGASFAVKMPALERLHSVGIVGLQETVIQVLYASNPPTLTHLRISAMLVASRLVRAELARNLRMKAKAIKHAAGFSSSSDEKSQPRMADLKLPNLRHVVTHSYHENLDGRFYNDRSAPKVGDGFTMVHLNKYHETPYGFCYDAWLDRVQGGVGCWVHSQEEEDQREEVLLSRTTFGRP